MGKALGGGSIVGNGSSGSSSLSPRRQFRNSDILLALLTGIACISSIAHIFMHSHTLPSSSSSRQQHPHHKNILKEALDNFVQQTKRRDISTDNINNENDSNDQGDDDGEEKEEEKEADVEEEEEEAAAATNGKTILIKPDDKPATIKQKVLSFLGKKEETKTNNDNNKEEKIHPVAHLNCADHGGPTDPHIIDEMVFWSDIPSDASYLSPMHPLNDPYTPDDTERYLTFEPDHGGWSKSSSIHHKHRDILLCVIGYTNSIYIQLNILSAVFPSLFR